jgi:D-alanyl-D-alanine carboxypeptidase
MGGVLMGLRSGFRVDFRKLDPGCGTHSGLVTGWLAMAAAMITAGPIAASATVRSSIVIDARSGEVLEAHNADTLCYPASLAKLMTLYVTFQRLSNGRMTMRQKLRVSSHAAAQPPTKLRLRAGELIPVELAILAITTKSANDAAVLLAEAIAGTETRFAHLMNRIARQLGLNHTTFYNASGLPNRRQRTTARDMGKLALAILHHFPQYYHVFKVRSFVFRGRTIYGHNHLLGRYRGADGMKTGYIRASGYNIVASAVRHGRRLVGVVMGGSSIGSRDRLVMALLDRSFSRGPAGTVIAAAAAADTAQRYRAAAYLKVSDRAVEHHHVSPHHDRWLVQIGGHFHSPHHARRALRSAIHTAPASLKGAKPLVVRLGHTRYRARFSNVSEAMARGTCQVLRRRKFECAILRLRPSSVAVASAER